MSGYAGLRLLETLVLPPASLLFLAGIGLGLRRRVLTLIALTLLYLAATPWVSRWLAAKLEVYPPLDPNRLPTAQAIVVLGAMRYHQAPEYGGDTVAGLGLERLRYAAWLKRRTGLPILASGGRPLGESKAEAELMQEVLQEFGTPATWLETQSRNTFENAKHSAVILKRQGIKTIFLVTSAFHLPRAVEAFTYQGLGVIPAGTRFTRPGPLESGLWAWLPSPSALCRTHLALHEIFGRLWYRLRYYSQPLRLKYQ
ncbi:YdcF family protein [Methylothermus subterraneus]